MTDMTMREYAASLGLAKLGVRGRMPRLAKEAIEKAIAEGMTFTDAKVTKNEAGEIAIAKKDPAGEIPDIPEYLRDLTHEVYEFSNGKKVHRSMREVCRNCGGSLVVCHCGAPVIVSLDGNPAGTKVFFGAAGYGELKTW